MRRAPARALLAVLCAGAAQAAQELPRFVEETASAGISSRFDGEWEYVVGGGAAAFDCDGSGRPALWLAGGVNRARFYRNQGPLGGALKFAEQRSGLELTSALGAYPVDLDGDGQVDLVVLRVGETLLMRGLGECRFERANERWGFAGGNEWTTAFSAAWLGGNARPTLAFGSYVARTAQEFPWGSCTPGRLFQALPQAVAGTAQTELRFEPARPLQPGHCALSMMFSDWNRSGTPALRVANDREYYQGGQEQLWRVSPSGEARLYGPADGWRPLQIWGMGIAGTDLDGSGYPAYFLTSMADNKLQVLADAPAAGPAAAAAPRPAYKDAAYARGVTAHRPFGGGDVKPSTAWHAQFDDVNNDGFADLFIVKGNIGQMPDFAMLDPSNLLLAGADGRFTEVAERAGLVNVQRGRGGLLADFNGDGLLDAVIVNRWGPARVWRNVGSGSAAAPAPLGHWLQVRLRQEGGNRDAIGAWIEVEAAGRIQRRELTVGGGHASGVLGFVHVGLGAAESARLRVRWPGASGADDAAPGVSAWVDVAADRFYLFDRRSGLKPWAP